MKTEDVADMANWLTGHCKVLRQIPSALDGVSGACSTFFRHLGKLSLSGGEYLRGGMLRCLSGALGVVLAAAACSSPNPSPDSAPQSVRAPAYLSIKDFDRCLATRKIETYQVWCLPEAQPAECPAESWLQLTSLPPGDRVSKCSASAQAPR